MGKLQIRVSTESISTIAETELIASHSGQETLHIAINKIKERKMLNVYSDHGQTPLHIATIHGHDMMAQVLIDAGADQNKPMLPCIVSDCNNQCRQPHNCQEVHGGVNV